MEYGLQRYGLFAGALAFAGLPLYIHAPKFIADEYGLSLSLIGVLLLALRSIDVIQDPLIGHLLDKRSFRPRLLAATAIAVMALALFALFAIPAPFAPAIWFVLCMVALFSAYSLLTIMFYAQGITKATQIGHNGHVKVAAWREGGALLGVCIAAVIPSLFALSGGIAPMRGYAIVFVAICIAAMLAMRLQWTNAPQANSVSIRAILSDPILRRLLMIALLNAAPVAITANLFLFFVEYRLGSAIAAGPLLLLFFLAAALSVPIWGFYARQWGMQRSLQIGMLIAIISFGLTLTLARHDLWPFAVICVLSGAALGADMTLLPAAFARRLAVLHDLGGQAFGLWGFCAKFTLALAAGVVLPALSLSGFHPGTENSDHSLWVLTLLYAGLPCVLKMLTLVMVSSQQLSEVSK